MVCWIFYVLILLLPSGHCSPGSLSQVERAFAIVEEYSDLVSEGHRQEALVDQFAALALPALCSTVNAQGESLLLATIRAAYACHDKILLKVLQGQDTTSATEVLRNHNWVSGLALALLPHCKQIEFNTQNSFGLNALHASIRFRLVDVVSALIERGADARMTTGDGRNQSALHLCVMHGDADLLAIVVSRLNPDLELGLDANGNHPLDLALPSLLSSMEKALHRYPWVASAPARATLDVAGLHEMNAGGWHVASTDVDTRCDVETITAREVMADPTLFWREFVLAGKPVIVTEVVDESWPAASRWTRHNLAAMYGVIDVNGGKIPYGKVFGTEHGHVGIAEFIEYMGSHADEHEVPYYVFDGDIGIDTDILDDLRVPAALIAPLLNGTWRRASVMEQCGEHSSSAPSIIDCVDALLRQGGLKDLEGVIPQFYLGGARTGAPFHYHCAALNILMFGRKKWWFHPPQSARYSVRPPATFIDDAPAVREALQCVQPPRSIAFVPEFWGHATLNLDATVGMALEFPGYC